MQVYIYSSLTQYEFWRAVSECSNEPRASCQYAPHVTFEANNLPIIGSKIVSCVKTSLTRDKQTNKLWV